jgi:3-oxoacyl-[acyl-carrier protein] reductase
MDLGIAGRTALVCASSRGLGRACAEALAAEGVQVFINGRDSERLSRALAEMRAVDIEARAVAADVTTDEGRAALLQACPNPDILINNNAGPSPRSFVDITREDWLVGLEANLIAPLMLVRAVLPGMRRRRFGRIINITSAMVKLPNP